MLTGGTLIPAQRRTGKADRPDCSGKHHRHGLHFPALTDEKGRLIWISAARPGRSHDTTTAARRDKTVEHLKAAGPGALGFPGMDKPENPDDLVIVTGCKATRARKLTHGQKRASRILTAGRPRRTRLREPQGLRILTKPRTDPARATPILRALLVLTNLEAGR